MDLSSSTSVTAPISAAAGISSVSHVPSAEALETARTANAATEANTVSPLRASVRGLRRRVCHHTLRPVKAATTAIMNMNDAAENHSRAVPALS
ncbi:hypothetical protein [Glycomyces harbinensis]|uniref:Uncharacterized protein n=1 Tax=Glycomyces harbinensis TaxID=58114 RepID=A0A1G7APD4_9ACTN|nr:hypothetical protein [Glycomyces harbinensis]SDE15865.1 hypothetical protein SAMN05216270_11430 [Glycomyces harbinensis]